MKTITPKTGWRFDGHGINAADGQRIATFTEHLKGAIRYDGDPTAAIMCAAPDLLEAVRRAAFLLERIAAGDHRALENAARAAADMRKLLKTAGGEG